MSDMTTPSRRRLRVTIIARHYPPEISGGARRPYLLAQGLRAIGHRVSVVSPQSVLNHEDDNFVPHPIALNTPKASETHMSSESHFRAWLRTWLLWPDPDIRWAKRVQATLKSDFQSDVILTTSPPESSHAIGYKLRRENTIWIAEMRDGWVENPLRDILLRSRVRRSIEKRLARFWLKKAQGIIAVSGAISEEAQRHTRNIPVKFIGHFADTVSSPEFFSGEGPHFLHTGRFSLSHPDRKLSSVLAQFEKVALSFPPDAKLHLIGELSPEEKTSIAKHPCSAKIVNHGQTPMALTRRLQAGADVLVLSQHEGSTSIPGKYAEYIAAKRPIAIVGEGPWRDTLQNGPIVPLKDITPKMLGVLAKKAVNLPDANISYEAVINEYVDFFLTVIDQQ